MTDPVSLHMGEKWDDACATHDSNGKKPVFSTQMHAFHEVTLTMIIDVNLRTCLSELKEVIFKVGQTYDFSNVYINMCRQIKFLASGNI